LLTARGELVKVITDDDAFYWPGIQACKQYMLRHAEIDAIGTAVAGTGMRLADPFVLMDYQSDYLAWTQLARPFGFCGLGHMLRRRSFALMGLFHPDLVRVDLEFTLRLTSGSANVAWYTGYTWTRIANLQSNAITLSRVLNDDSRRLEDFYRSRTASRRYRAKTQTLKRVFSWLKTPFRPLKRWLITFRASNSTDQLDESSKQAKLDASEAFERCDRWLAEKNQLVAGKFLCKEGIGLP
jgi:hypothetical protein